MSHMGNLKLNQPANSIFSGDDKNKALNNFKFREKKIQNFADRDTVKRYYICCCNVRICVLVSVSNHRR